MGLIGNMYGMPGYAYQIRGKADKALVLYEKAMAKGVSIPGCQMAYGVMLLRRGEFEQARQVFGRLIIEYPHSDPVRNRAKVNQALAYWKLGDLDTALDMLTEVHNKLRNSRTYSILGYLLIEAGDLEKALEFNLEALDYDDTDEEILDNLGQIYYLKGDLDEALRYFGKAYEENPDQLSTLYHLGCIYHDKGDKAKALEYLKKASARDISALSTVSRDRIEERLQALEHGQDEG
ncbi:MAG TPA: tetratricopeptide repeat protein [Candidatus Atribacteria bacterium]|nr:tetratricopeptide repeat protein [Candidatus Atribacteria bacterium]